MGNAKELFKTWYNTIEVIPNAEDNYKRPRDLREFIELWFANIDYGRVIIILVIWEN